MTEQIPYNFSMNDKMIKYSKIAGITLVLGIYGIFAAFGIARFDSWRLSESKKMLMQGQETQGKDSLVLLQKAAFLNPCEETYLKTGLKAEELGLGELAGTYFKRVRTANGYFELGTNYFNQKRYDNAVETYSKAIARQKDSKYFLARAKAYLAIANIDKAKADIQNSFGVETGNEARYYETLVRIIKGENTKVPEVGQEYKSKLDSILSYTDSINRTIAVYNALNAQDYPQLARWYLKEQGKKETLSRDGYLLLAKVNFEEQNYRAQYDALLKAKSKDEFYPQTYQQLAQAAKKLNLVAEATAYQAYYDKLTW